MGLTRTSSLTRRRCKPRSSAAEGAAAVGPAWPRTRKTARGDASEPPRTSAATSGGLPPCALPGGWTAARARGRAPKRRLKEATSLRVRRSIVRRREALRQRPGAGPDGPSASAARASYGPGIWPWIYSTCLASASSSAPAAAGDAASARATGAWRRSNCFAARGAMLGSPSSKPTQQQPFDLFRTKKIDGFPFTKGWLAYGQASLA